MTKAEWGLKRICPSCNTRYYDMKKNPPVCPQCGVIFDPDALLRTRRGRVDPKKSTTPSPEESIEDLPLADTEADDSLIEDTDDLTDEDVEIDVEKDDDRDR